MVMMGCGEQRLDQSLSLNPDPGALKCIITDRINREGIGALGSRGQVSVLGTFMRVDPQWVSGVRIVGCAPVAALDRESQV
jgi:hypothetical protein